MVLALCPLSPESGVKTLIRAMSLVPPPLEAVIAGEDAGYTGAMLIAFAESLGVGGRIRFPGRVTDADQLLRSALVGVAPCLGGRADIETAMEMMAFGVPLLAASTGGFPDLVQDGVTGILHSPGNWRQLAGQISHLAINRGFAVYLAKNAMFDCRRKREQLRRPGRTNE